MSTLLPRLGTRRATSATTTASTPSGTFIHSTQRHESASVNQPPRLARPRRRMRTPRRWRARVLRPSSAGPDRRRSLGRGSSAEREQTDRSHDDRPARSGRRAFHTEASRWSRPGCRPWSPRPCVFQTSSVGQADKTATSADGEPIEPVRLSGPHPRHDQAAPSRNWAMLAAHQPQLQWQPPAYRIGRPAERARLQQPIPRSHDSISAASPRPRRCVRRGSSAATSRLLGA